MNYGDIVSDIDNQRFELERAREKAARIWRFRNVGRKRAKGMGEVVKVWRAAVRVALVAARRSANRAGDWPSQTLVEPKKRQEGLP
jgi:hypothetical protein